MALSACASNTALLNPRYPARLPGAGGSDNGPQAQNSPRHGGGAHADPDHRGGTWKPYQVNGRWYYPAEQPDYNEIGMASWYGDAFNGKPTADGEIFDMLGFTAAHKTLPLPCMVEVTNLDNGKSMQLRVNDRGPFVGDRLIDLSKGAADKLGVLRPGLARVRVRYVGPATDAPAHDPWREDNVQIADATPPPRTVKPHPAAAPARGQAVLPPLAGTLPTLDAAALQPLHVADPDDVQTASLAPTEASPANIEDLASSPSATTTTLASPPSAPAVAAPVVRYSIQAGAFASRANAEKAASQLASVGQTEIMPLERNGSTLYRVVVGSLNDEAAADNALQQVAASGYRDARIILP